jgi:hypothetical protein
MMTKVNLKISRDNWKKKAIQRRTQIKHLQQRIQELESSRQAWKQKALTRPGSARRPPPSPEKVARHTYPAGVIWFCIYMYLMGKSSLRACRQGVMALGLYLGQPIRLPCASSIRMWVCKYGYDQYQQPKQGGAWALLVDESVSIGQERLLLVLGVNLDTWDFKRALRHGDVEVLGMAIAPSWTSASISQQLDQLAPSYSIAYVVSDEGNNLRATWKARQMLHISDCTHLWAKSLERVYKEDASFGAFMQAVTALRKRWILSSNAPLLPPATRIKSRFHQVFSYVSWAARITQVQDKLSTQQRADLSFLSDHALLLAGLSDCQALVGELNGLFKIKGLSHRSIAAGLSLLDGNLPDLPTVSRFKAAIRSYLVAHEARLTPGETYLCCSDIIESSFGVYKQCLCQNQGSMTELVLGLAGLGKPLLVAGVKDAMERVKVGAVTAWKAANTTPSLAKSRRDFFSKKGVKK